MRPFLLRAQVFGLLFLLAFPAVAQPVDYSVGASYRGVFLSDGDINAQAVRLTGTHALSPLAGVAAHVGYQFALNNTMRDAVHGDWTDYRAMLAGVSGYLDPLWVWTGTMEHRLRFSLGPAVRYRDRKHPQLLAHPAAYEDGLVSSDMGFDRYYQEHLEGPDLEEEGVYTLFTMEESGMQLGTRLGATYRLYVGRFIVGVDGDMHVFGGERVLSYGLLLGLGW